MREVDDLVAAFVAAYRPYVLGRLADLGVEPPPRLPDRLAEGERWLRDALEALLALPFRQQHRAPLEVFQEAMRFPTEALQEAAVVPVARDETAANALPGDLYDLAPASSQALGEEAWQAHLAWGAAKARAFAEE